MHNNFNENNKNFPIYEQFNQLLNDDEYNQILSKVNLEINFENLKMLNLKNEINTFKKVYNDEELYNIINDTIINKLNKNNLNFQYVLIKDEIEIIKYIENDSLKIQQQQQHSHYEHQNEINHYNMMIFLNVECEGGDIILYSFKNINKNKNIIIQAKNGNILIFKNELTYENTIIKKGYKYILKANLWLNKKCNDTFIIKFKDNRFYIIPMDIIKKYPLSYFGAYINFK